MRKSEELHVLESDREVKWINTIESNGLQDLNEFQYCDSAWKTPTQHELTWEYIKCQTRQTSKKRQIIKYQPSSG